jgi:methyl coenzyme M reductase subunit C-like uncharacterized protein (methanogenesis marker protein 7)
LIEKRKAILTDLEKQVIQKKNHLISLDLLIADRMKSSERIANQLDIKISSLVDQCNELEKFKAKLQFDTFNREVVHQDLQFQINILEADLLILTEKSQENCIKTKKNRLFRKALQDLR